MATGHAMLINLHLNRLNTINSNTDPRSVAKRAMATGHAMLINLHLNRLNTINSNTDPRASGEASHGNWSCHANKPASK